MHAFIYLMKIKQWWWLETKLVRIVSCWINSNSDPHSPAYPACIYVYDHPIVNHQILSIHRTIHCSPLPGLLGGVEQMVCGQLHHDQDIIPVCKYIANTNTRQSHNTNLVRSESRSSLTLKQNI